MLYYAGTQGGTGDIGIKWLVADGRSLDRRFEFNDLFKHIGTIFGSVDAEHFNLPNASKENGEGSSGLLPKAVSVNDGGSTQGVAGTATISATLVENNIPPLQPQFINKVDAGFGFNNDALNWTSTVDRSVLPNDSNGASNNTDSGPTNEPCLLANQPVSGAFLVKTSDPVVAQLAAAVPINQALTLTAELPTRYEMRMMIKANY
tara:strand:- start:10755 stop:11369 length:615 start_codon:yes stop_codon:yes gene_type:complete